MSEIGAKMDMKVRVDELKESINRENCLTVEQVTRHAAQQEVEHLKRIVAANRKIAKYTDHYSSLLSALDASIDTLAQRKPEAKSELTAYALDATRIRKRIAEERAREVNIHAALAELEEQFAERRQAITPLMERGKRNGEQSAAYLEERRRLVEEIKVKEKQLELIFIVKSLSFEEA
jgi:chromosome segregation ATPase